MNENKFNLLLNIINENNIKTFHMFGFGEVGKLFYNHIKQDINVINIYDNNYQKFKDESINIQRFENKDNIPILVSVGKEHFSEINNQLVNNGLKPNQDFFDAKEYIPLLYFSKYNKIVLQEVHLAVTTRCTLNCQNCNMFIPSYDIKNDEKIEDIIETIDNTFKNIDKILKFVLLGGEPFLYKNFEELLDYIIMHYSNNIGLLEIITNGTIIPSKNILEKLQKYNVQISISDYTSAVNYTEKLELFKKELDNYNIHYIIKQSLQWLDFLFPYSKFNIDKSKIKAHMLSCSPLFKGVNDSKFYYCHIVWSAVKAGILKENQNDYIDISKKLNHDERLNLLKFYYGLPDQHYISLCEFCAGCGEDNKLFISPAIQKDNRNE